jgi:hypothetical protein
MQRLCHEHARLAFVGAALLWSATAPVRADPPVHDYPTHARVEYVNECVAKHGSKLSTVYQCSCAIDRIANALSYDDFVEAATFSKYAGLPGEGGGIFRDSEQARKMAKLYRELEADAYRVCGLAP